MGLSANAQWRPAADGSDHLEWWDGSRWSGIRSPRAADRSGWFADPSDLGWRWWSRDHWTSYLRPIGRRPALPAWLSVPIVLVAVIAGWTTVAEVAAQPGTLALALIPVVVLLFVFLRLNQVHPVSRQARVHAFLWGAVVAGSIAGIINDEVAAAWGEDVAIVLSAPIGEELLKGAGVLVAVRRGEIKNRLQGAAIACWIAAGFTLVEEIVYLSFAFEDGNVAETFVIRGVLTGFVHPLVTVWIGLAVGVAIERVNRPVGGALVGLVPAIALHMAWNASSDEAMAIVYVVFIGILLATIGMLVSQRDRYAQRHDRAAAAILRAASGAGAVPHETELLRPFLTVESARGYRQSLSRQDRPAFDTAYAAIAGAFDVAGSRGSITPAEISSVLGFARATTVGRRLG